MIKSIFANNIEQYWICFTILRLCSWALYMFFIK